MALLLSSVFLLFVIVVRVLRQYQVSGDHGIRMAKTGAPLSEIIPGSVFILTFVVSIVLIVLNALDLLPINSPLPQSVGLIGCAIGFSGILITVIAQWQMGKSWRIGVDQSERTSLISTGLYAKSRNPIYFGILLYWVGLVLTLPHPAMLACAIISWCCIEIIVRKVEEPYLEKVHGEAFAAYAARAKRYLPL